MTDLLKSLRLKRLGISQVTTVDTPDTGLIDSGATSAALRQAVGDELSKAKRVKVQLAVGETELWLSDWGTLLSEVPLQPILPMACLPALGCAVSWTDRGITLVHPSQGVLPVKLRGACPELPADMAVQLIKDFEVLEGRNEAARLKRMHLWDEDVGADMLDGEDLLMWLSRQVHSEGLTEAVQLRFLKRFFPALPRRIAMRVVCPPEYDPHKVPFNRSTRRALFNPDVPTLVHLFSGAQQWKDCPGQVLSVELQRGADLCSDHAYGMLLKAAVAGTVKGCIAGPPCRTTSACRRAPASTCQGWR